MLPGKLVWPPAAEGCTEISQLNVSHKSLGSRKMERIKAYRLSGAVITLCFIKKCSIEQLEAQLNW